MRHPVQQTVGVAAFMVCPAQFGAHTASDSESTGADHYRKQCYRTVRADGRYRIKPNEPLAYSAIWPSGQLLGQCGLFGSSGRRLPHTG